MNDVGSTRTTGAAKVLLAARLAQAPRGFPEVLRAGWGVGLGFIGFRV